MKLKISFLSDNRKTGNGFHNVWLDDVTFTNIYNDIGDSEIVKVKLVQSFVSIKMHGQVKTRTTEEQREVEKREKCKKVKAYQAGMKIVLDKRSSSCCDQEALDLTANLLTKNPDIITLWNYRREILLKLKNDDDLESYKKLVEKELNLTEQCLRVNPKSYGSWHYRIWLLDSLPEANWERELNLCTKYLKLDERNFHCWDYRRIVTQRANVSDVSEYDYTLEKIKVNFSNYSAWHLRSKLLPKIFPDPEKKFPIDEAKHKEELELVENAAFTDPNDQSAWFYLRWLLGLTEPKTSLVFADLRKDEIFIVASRSLKLNEGKLFLNVKINNEEVKGRWESHNNEEQSCIWSFKPIPKVQADTVDIILKENGTEFKYLLQTCKPCKPVLNQPVFHPIFSENLMETLKNQLNSCKELLELEPDSKWTLLTSIFLMLYIDYDRHQSHIFERLNKLCEVDSLRKGYYLDLRSKFLIESAISKSFNKMKNFNLKNHNLTCFYHSQYLFDFEEIDLSFNSIQSESLKVFSDFVKCRSLNLSSNKIKSLKYLPVMPELEVLLLDYNLICDEIDWEHLKKFPNLRKVSLAGNPIADKKEMVDDISNKLGNIKLSFLGTS